tara:strand:+ start:701 stop:949 length:249 start_codon:yes stop_codon:yes gene_type:complete
MKVATEFQRVSYLAKKPRTVEELSIKFGITERTVYRVIENLHQSGFRVTKSEGIRTPTYQIETITTELKNQIKFLHEQFKIH